MMFKRLSIFFLTLLMTAGMAQSGFAQKSKSPAERTVSGVVSDGGGKPVPGAVVQLENKKTLQIRSFIAKDGGQYIFNGLSTDSDYELTAKAGEMVSAKKILSSFDSRKDAVMNLTVK